MGFLQARNSLLGARSVTASSRISPDRGGLPLHTILSWRADLAATRHGSIRVFHDGPAETLSSSLTGDGLRLPGSSAIRSFVSIAVAFPDHVRESLDARHILRLDAALTLSRPLNGFVRLNLRHGPDTETSTRATPLQTGACVAEFDLSVTSVGKRPLHHAWIDVIFDHPRDVEIIARDVVLSCRPRAEC